MVLVACSGNETASHAASGSGGDTATSQGSGAAPGACKTDSECTLPGPCELGVCGSDGSCSTESVEAGTPLSEQHQEAGDCAIAVCGESGDVASIDDWKDLPDDGNDCSYGVCTEDGPSSLPVAVEAPCETDNGKVCDGMGKCVECLGDSDCGDLTACSAPKCVAQECQYNYTMDGTRIPGQRVGDCHSTVCDGMGSTKVVIDDEDVPVDPDLTDCIVPYCATGNKLEGPAKHKAACGDGTGKCCNTLCCSSKQACLNKMMCIGEI